MFGPWMEVRDNKHVLRLGPIKREEMFQYVDSSSGFGMQSYEVTKYLNRTSAQTIESELAWWDNISADENERLWGLYLEIKDQWRLIGSSGLHFPARSRARATSGFLIFDRNYWRQGWAKRAHLARTLYAFDELGLISVDSSAAMGNIGSRRALHSVGYVPTGIVHGRPIDVEQLLMVNPNKAAWNHFWSRPKSEIPQDFHDARLVTKAALERARTMVTFL
jgi:RimJ/RimL family protein N-acetyltransferase